MLTQNTIRDCIAESASLFEALKKVYDRIPATHCSRKTDCCSLLPEASLVETLAVLQNLQNMAFELRNRVYIKLVEYFFLNPVKITSCPFLEGRDCLVYPNRFYGCRAYGLWSYETYQKLANRNRKSKIGLQQQWKRLKITLPQQVIDFNIPYCREVEAGTHFVKKDQELTDIWNAVNKLSELLSPRHEVYQQKFFGDLSFLASVLAFGFNKALQLKYAIVRDVLVFNNNNRFNNIIENLTDFDI